MIKSLITGYHYMKEWPLDDYLNPVFKENRVKKSMLFANRVLPPLLVFTLVWSLYLGGYFKGVPFLYAISMHLEVTIISIIVLVTIPLQGYYWFYKRSKTALNEKQQVFYRELCKQLGHSFTLMPTMSDLEKEINFGIKILGREFLKKL